MATRTVFSDEDNNEMECYLNSKGRVYLKVGQAEEDILQTGFITLDKSDVKELIRVLAEIEKDMKD